MIFHNLSLSLSSFVSGKIPYLLVRSSRFEVCLFDTVVWSWTLGLFSMTDTFHRFLCWTSRTLMVFQLGSSNHQWHHLYSIGAPYLFICLIFMFRRWPSKDSWRYAPLSFFFLRYWNGRTMNIISNHLAVVSKVQILTEVLHHQHQRHW